MRSISIICSVALAISAGAARADAEPDFATGGRRDVVIQSPESSQALVQTTSATGRLRFDLCAISLAKYPTNADLVSHLNQGRPNCQPLVDLSLDPSDQRVLDFVRERFVQMFGAQTVDLAGRHRKDAVIMGGFGTAIGLTTVPLLALLWTDAGFLNPTRVQLLGSRAVLGTFGLAVLAVPLAAAYVEYRRAEGIAHARLEVDRLFHEGRMIGAPAPVISAEAFRFITMSLGETLLRTADALTLR